MLKSTKSDNYKKRTANRGWANAHGAGTVTEPQLDGFSCVSACIVEGAVGMRGVKTNDDGSRQCTKLECPAEYFVDYPGVVCTAVCTTVRAADCSRQTCRWDIAV